MLFSYPRSTLALLAVLSLSAPASAQYQPYPRTPAYDPSLQTQAVVRGAALAPGGYSQGAGYSPGPNPYGTYRQTPLNGATTGVADLTTADANWYATIEQAKLTQEDVRRSQMDTRRKVYDEMEYEQDQTRRLAQKKKAQDKDDLLQQARDNPPTLMVWSGEAMNVLIGAIRDAQTHYGVRGANIPLDQAMLAHINVSTGTTYGSVGLFRDGQPLNWPLGLQEDRFDDSRKKIETLSAKSVSSVAKGKPDGKAIRDLIAAIAALKDQVAAATNDQSPTDNIQAMRYVGQLREAAKTLTDPASVGILAGKQAARGYTVAELVDNLGSAGVKIAPCNEGDEAAYNAIYRSIVLYDASILRFIGSQQQQQQQQQ